jgi:large subunit ribosomal protein L18
MKSNKAFIKRQKKVRSLISRSSLRGRLSVFRSNKHIYAQIIDNQKGTVLVSSSDLKGLSVEDKKLNKTETAFIVGEEIAKKALKKKISEVVFDRGGYKYHGRVKAIAEGARKGGLIF